MKPRLHRDETDEIEVGGVSLLARLLAVLALVCIAAYCFAR